MRIDCKCGKGLTEDLSETLADFDEYGSVIATHNAFEVDARGRQLGKVKSGVFFYTPERHPHRDSGEGPIMLTFTPLGLGVAEIPHIPTGIAVGLGSILAGVIPELPPTKYNEEGTQVIDVEGWNGRWYGCCNWADLELECECGNTLGLVEIDCEQLDMVTFYKENVVQSS